MAFYNKMTWLDESSGDCLSQQIFAHKVLNFEEFSPFIKHLHCTLAENKVSCSCAFSFLCT